MPIAKSKTTCFHCHDTITEKPILFADKSFCCEGCKTVYQILDENNLCTFYTLDVNAGTTQKGKTPQYAYMDDAETVSKIVDYQDDSTTRVTFLLPSMHCASCIWLLENLHRIDPAIFNSKVNFLKREVTILFSNQEIKLRRIAEILASIGYAPEINFNDVENEGEVPIDRTIYYKLGVAFFAFGNIMLLSFPEYLGLDASLERGFAKFFGYINLVLATPVLLYSSRDYLVSAWQGVKQQTLNIDIPLSLGIIALYGRSAFEILTHTGAGYMDSFAGLIFFLLSGKWFQQKTFNHLSFERDYKSYFPVAANVRREGREVPTPINKLQIGEIITVRNGELVPADGVILRGDARMDYSFVTGEADPVSKKSGDKVFAGGRQMGSSVDITLTKRVSQSYLTELWNNEAFKTAKKSHISYLADRAGRYFTGVILLVSMVAFFYWLPQDMGKAINAATAVLIVACPCAVALAIPFTMGNILRILGRHEFYVKNTQVIENFERIDAVVFDKTGTITERLKNEVSFVNTSHSDNLDSAKSQILSVVRHSNHPLSIQIAEYLKDSPFVDITDYEEVIGKGVQANANQQLVKVGSAEFIGEKAQSDPSVKGVFVSIDDLVIGYFDMKPTYRTGFQQIINTFKTAGKDVFILSGDNEKERPFLAQFLTDKFLNFNQTPSDKLNFIKKLQSQGQKVLMIGDGLNDAGALQQSDIGVVISENTNNFSPACDAILKADQFPKLPEFLHLSKMGSVIVNRAYLIALCYNIVGLSYAVSSNLSPVVAAILMPLSSVTIVLFGVLTGNYMARRLEK
ncbi:MAG: heavy metal translocating P-type ATPase metal-binding domain-containing protein [Saprospiraceae bacterium]|nr:heavy metal translocating P-type ATPase metal-binding domain-containing protein [Saprospiraceae bacterium]